MSCNRQPEQAARAGRQAGLSRLTAKKAFYGGLGLVTAGATTALLYPRLTPAGPPPEAVQQALSLIQQASRLGTQALDPQTPGERRLALLGRARDELMATIEPIKDAPRSLKRALVWMVITHRLALATAEAVVKRPGDQAALAAVRKTFRATHLIFWPPVRQRGRALGRALLAGGAAGLAGAGTTWLALRPLRKRAQARTTHPAAGAAGQTKDNHDELPG